MVHHIIEAVMKRKEDVFSLTCIEAMRLGKTKKMILKVSRKTLKPRNADFAVI